jgi:hypothetical protein
MPEVQSDDSAQNTPHNPLRAAVAEVESPPTSSPPLRGLRALAVLHTWDYEAACSSDFTSIVRMGRLEEDAA